MRAINAISKILHEGRHEDDAPDDCTRDRPPGTTKLTISGTVRGIANHDGTLVAHFRYDAFGRILEGDTSLTRYLYTAREFDASTGLQYNRNRWYASYIGAWLSEDPDGFRGGDTNLYRYVGNGPTNGTDPSGLAGQPSGYWAGVGQTAKGYFWTGPKNLVVGIGSMIAHPIDTVTGIGGAVLHPIETVNAVGQLYAEKAQSLEGQGEIAFEAALIVTPAGLSKLDALRSASRTARIANEVQVVQTAKGATSTARAVRPCHK